MSGLGTAIPASGEEGFSTGSAPPPMQSSPNNEAEIIHTTAVESIDFLLNRDYIYQGTYTLDSTMLPGHVFAILDVHPHGALSHQYIDHIAKIFNGWTGQAEARFRFMANAFNGGSIRVGFLPPNITESQIRTMSLATLTAFPNVDLDPKNTNWVHMSANDERNIMFHWMAEASDPAKPETFGGYLVFYVAGQLVSGNLQGGEVQLYVEVRGDYKFLQPNPAFAVSSGEFAGPLSSAALQDLAGQLGCDDMTAGTSTVSGVQIFASTTRSLPCGFGMAYGYNGTTPLDHSSGASWDQDYWQYARPQAASLGNYPSPMAIGALTSTDPNGTAPPSGANWVIGLFPNPQSSSQMLNATNAELTSYKLPSQHTTVAYSVPNAPESGSVNMDWWHAVTAKAFGTVGSRRCFYVSGRDIATDRVVPANTTLADYQAPLGLTDRLGDPIVAASAALPGHALPANNSESLVAFVNTFLRTMNLQTFRMARDLATSSNLSANTTYVYTLRNLADGEPIINLRLWPNGSFSTNAVTSDTLILKPNDQLYLQFERQLPTGSPLPPLARTQRAALRDYTKAGSHSSSERRLKAFSAL